MSQYKFQFLFVNLMIFKIKKINYSFFIFIFHICAKFQTKKKLIMTCVFECFNHIVTFRKNYMNFSCMVVVGTKIIFGENSFILLVLWVLVTWGLSLTFEKGGRGGGQTPMKAKTTINGVW
jgi:hypothetical protein